MTVPFLSLKDKKTARGKIPQLYGIHIFRIACAFAVFLFHSHGHVGVNYGAFNNFIGQCHIFMVAFFMLSGFSLYYVDEERGSYNVQGDDYVAMYMGGGEKIAVQEVC